jgi:hypothetical protein
MKRRRENGSQAGRNSVGSGESGRSHGLDVVDVEFIGPAKDRVLRVTPGEKRRGARKAEGGD